MPESCTHRELVNNLNKWIRANLNGVVEAFIYSDDPNSSDRPPVISGHIPDFYYHDSINDLTIIGEAKTPQDIECRHSMEQFRAYLEHASRARRAHIVIAVPWYAERTAAGLFRVLKMRSGIDSVNVTVIPKLAG